ncbi:MAG TPA: NAD-dependent epimerase/dehydratase family protein [Terrimicrobiaceae bacterium]
MILVTGGLGVMGSTLVKGLVDRGFKVRVLDNSDRFRSRLEGYDVEIRIGDITKPETLAGCFDEVDTVYHLAAVLIVYDASLFKKINVGGTRNIIAASIKAGVKHFILVSSASVTYAHTTPYSLSKQETERMIKAQTAMKWTIVRPTLAYNENGGEEFNMFLAYLKKYPIVPFIGAGTSLKRPVHCDDLMKGFLAIPGNAKTYGKTYAFSGGEAIAIRKMAKLMLKHVRQEKPFVTIPIPICRVIAFFAEKFQKKPLLTWNAIAGAMQDANLDNTEARQDLGYEPISFHEGLQRAYPI